MANPVSSFLKLNKLIRSHRNLVSLDDPYNVLAWLLKNREITGIIDAGASDGRISKRLLRKFPAANVYAFEPNPFYAESLKQYARQERRFHPQFLALSDHEGTADLYVTESPGATSLFAPTRRLREIEPQGSSVKTLEKVRVVTIDQWAKRNGNLGIHLMKFDIQAGELRALQGAVHTLETSTLSVYTEIWFNPAYNHGAIYSEIDLFLRKYGFVLYDIFKPKYDRNRLIMWANAIFVNSQRLNL